MASIIEDFGREGGAVRGNVGDRIYELSIWRGSLGGWGVSKNRKDPGVQAEQAHFSNAADLLAWINANVKD